MKNPFPNASKAFTLANPQVVHGLGQKDAACANVVRPWRAAVSLHSRKMNNTEAEFALRLEAMKRNGEILRYEFEGITLRWADMRYTPDFVVFAPTDTVMRNDHEFISTIKLIEVKGAHIWSRDIVRFKGARAYWPEFSFEMHQLKNKEWRRLH